VSQRGFFILVAVIVLPCGTFAQEGATNLAAGLKRAIIFGDQIELLQRYDNTDVHRKKSAETLGARNSFNKADDRFSEGKFPEAFMWYNVGFDHFLSIMNYKEPVAVLDTAKKINAYSHSQSVLQQRQLSRPTVEKAVEHGNYSYFGPEEYWEFSRGMDATAMVYQVKGNFNRAENLYLKALAMRGQQFGKTSEPYVCTLGNLATLRVDQGSFAAADEMFNYLINFYTKAKGTSSVEYLVTMNNKAMLDAAMGRKEVALRTLEGIANGNNILTTSSVLDAMRIRTNHALLLSTNNQADRAIQQLSEIRVSLEANKLDNHPDYYTIAIYLARIMIAQGKYVEGLELIETSLKKINNIFGKTHPLYLEALTIKADNLLHAQSFTEAQLHYAEILPALEQKFGIRNKSYLDVAVRNAYCLSKSNQTESARSQFQLATREYIKMTNTLFASLSENEQSKFWSMLKPQLDIYYQFVSENYLKYPELSGEAYNLHIQTKGLLINNSRKTRERVLASKDENLIRQFNRWRVLKENLTGYLNLEQEELLAQGIDLAEMESQINALEKKLVQASSHFRSQEPSVGDWKEVQQSLEPGEAAVEIIRINPRVGGDQSIRYLALILASGAPPALINYSDGERMESRDMAAYKNNVQFKTDDNVSFERFWGPLNNLLADKTTIYFSADGVFSKINVNGLRVPGGSYLIDKWKVVCLSNTKYLPLYKERLKAKPASYASALLVGNPDFGDPALVPQLPGTAGELDKIESILKGTSAGVTRLSGSEATKTAMKSQTKSNLVHVATHGFFLKAVDMRNTRDLLPGETMENPLLRSGLLLAGASKAMKDGTIQVSSESVLTAYETMTLDFDETSLIVLSACETGAGEIVNGEGVYGLIRAFQVAGAKATLISLWKVDDLATSNLMVNFYKFLSTQGEPVDAFREAQKALRQTYPDPYYWAAFVLHM